MLEPDFSRPRSSAQPRFDKSLTMGRRGAEHEKRIAKRSGAHRVRGSGSKPGRPADLRDIKFLREAKTTKGGGRFIKATELQKIVNQALTTGLVPIMEICFEGQAAPVPKDWVLIPAEDFDKLVTEQT